MLTPTSPVCDPAADEAVEASAFARPAAVLIVAAAVVAGAVLVLDVLPAWLTGPWHPSLSAAPLAATALGVALRELAHRRASGLVMVRAAVLAGGFASWSASQVTSGGPATACNDAAILLFIADVALGLVVRPSE